MSVALRQHELERASGQQPLTEAPGLATLVVAERRGELFVIVTAPAGAEPAAVRRAFSQRICDIAGGRSVAARLVITWAESPPLTPPAAV